MDSMIFCNNIFGNVINYTWHTSIKRRSLVSIKEIYCSQQFKIIFKKKTYERSVKYPQ